MYIFFISLFLITYSILNTSATIHAQQTSPGKDEQIPSDLSLDLKLAEQNPAPDQKKIADIQIEKAQITTDTGEKVDLAVKEEVPQEIKTQSAKDAVNTEQTTSEQVVNKTVEETVNPDSSANPATSGNPATGPTGNVIEGTNILEPDDNAAPPAPTSVSPSANPSGSGSPSQPDATSPAPSSDVQQPSTIPPENGVAPANSDLAPAPAPAAPQQASSPETAAPAPAADNTAPAPAPDNPAPAPAPAPDSSNADTGVQGVSTGPIVSWLRQLINKLLR